MGAAAGVLVGTAVEPAIAAGPAASTDGVEAPTVAAQDLVQGSPWQVSGDDIYFGGATPSPTQTFAESFERGVVGAAPDGATTAYDNSIGDNGDVGGNVTAVFAADGVAGQCVRFSNTTLLTQTWGFLGKNLSQGSSLYARRYLRIDVAPRYRTSVLLAKYGGIHGPHHGSVAIGGQGQNRRFVLVNVDTNSTVSSTPVPIGDWFRLEWHPDVDAGMQTLRIFVGDNRHGDTPDEVITAPVYAGAPIDYLEDGMLTDPGVLAHVDIDEAVNDSQTWPGPLIRDGRVGIGTSEPRHTLDVRGDASFSGDVVVAGALIAEGLAGVTPGPGYAPPSGAYLMPSNVTALTGSGLTAGRTTFVPVDVGPRPLDVAELVVSCSTAEAGGATRTVLAVYPDDGTGGRPDCSAGPLVSGQVSLTSTGVRRAAVSGHLTPGRYWVACGYYVSTSPSVAARLTSNNAASSSVTLWAQTFPTIVRYLYLDGDAALPTGPRADVGCGTDGGGVVVGIRAR
jgi:hypothetical protein